MLFLVVFFWTPPHYWALAMAYREDYATAEVPDAPRRSAEPVAVGRQIVAYSWVMVATSLLLVAGGRRRAGSTRAPPSWLGAVFLVEAHRLLGAAKRGVVGPALKPMRLFHYSNTYLSLALRRRRGRPAVCTCLSVDPPEVPHRHP